MTSHKLKTTEFSYLCMSMLSAIFHCKGSRDKLNNTKKMLNHENEQKIHIKKYKKNYKGSNLKTKNLPRNQKKINF